MGDKILWPLAEASRRGSEEWLKRRYGRFRGTRRFSSRPFPAITLADREFQPLRSIAATNSRKLGRHRCRNEAALRFDSEPGGNGARVCEARARSARACDAASQ